ACALGGGGERRARGGPRPGGGGGPGGARGPRAGAPGGRAAGGPLGRAPRGPPGPPPPRPPPHTPRGPATAAPDPSSCRGWGEAVTARAALPGVVADPVGGCFHSLVGVRRGLCGGVDTGAEPARTQAAGAAHVAGPPPPPLSSPQQ